MTRPLDAMAEVYAMEEKRKTTADRGRTPLKSLDSPTAIFDATFAMDLATVMMTGFINMYKGVRMYSSRLFI